VNGYILGVDAITRTGRYVDWSDTILADAQRTARERAGSYLG
jgi:hypothetical protein